MKEDRNKTITVNRKAYHDYFIEESIEAGIVLTGTEIKSVREGRVNIRDAYAKLENGELWLLNCHIAQYSAGNRYNHEPTRPRKLLLHKKEIAMLSSDAARKGLTLVPTRLYLKDGRAKIELGLAKGKKLYDKRRSIAQRESDRDVAQAVKVDRR
ncbi:MAG: SsrA-binding protein SmpB [Dehalococcoidia bacterium]|nr:SsrA-binding protein SmpB [Dehalococcoidia bacterium]